MKKTIFAFFLVALIGVSGALHAQTRKGAVRKRTTVKKSSGGAVVRKTTVATTKKIMNATNTSAAAAAATTTASGLTYIVTKPGDGAPLKAGDVAVVNYTGLLTNGAKFDSSLDRGEPFEFTLGAGMVIKGWDEAVQNLRVGDHATLIIPPAIGYGAGGAGGVIPPNATLIFIIEVVGAK